MAVDGGAAHHPANGETDEGGTAALLARAVELCQEREGVTYDLILCGKESTDEIGGQVGARLAERLGAAFVSSVVEAEPSGDGLKARQETEEVPPAWPRPFSRPPPPLFPGSPRPPDACTLPSP